MKAKYAGQGLVTIGIHSPEFEWEHEREAVKRAASRFGLDQPIYLDNDLAFWNGLGNRYWPSFYLVDKRGWVRLRAVGEMHQDTDEASRFEGALRRLLVEA